MMRSLYYYYADLYIYFRHFIRLQYIYMYRYKHAFGRGERSRKSDDLARRGSINGIPSPPLLAIIIVSFFTDSAWSPLKTAIATAATTRIESF